MSKAQPPTRQDAAAAPTAASLTSRLLTMPVATVLLFLLATSFPGFPCWSLFFLAAIVAWPVWHYQQEYVLFQRHAVLARATTEDSSIRRWLWAGRLTRILQVFVALVWAILLLSLGALLQPGHWLLLAVDVFILALLVGPLRRRMASQVQAQQLGVLVRRWPLLLFNLVFLSVAFLLVDFLVIGVADTRDMAWYTVAEQAFDEQASMAACLLSGSLTGLLAAIERLTWHLSQMVIPDLPDELLRLTAWVLFLLQAGVFAYAFTRFQLGIVGLLDARKLRLATLTGEGSFSKAFVLTILILAIPYLYAVFKLQDYDPGDLQQKRQQIISWLNPCEPDKAAMAELEQQFDDDISAARASARQDAENQVDTRLDELFTDVESGVDHYLDWYFTVIGEYERLAVVATGDLGQFMTEQLERHLFRDTHFGERLEAANQAIVQEAEQQMSALHRRLGYQADVSVQAEPCGLGDLDLSAFGDPARDRIRASTAAGGGALIAVGSSKLLAKKTAAAVVGKVSAKKSFTAATALIGKASSKKGGAVLLSAAGGAAMCAPGGPLAAVCGIVTGVVVWFTFDKAFIEVDEALFRDEMRSNILAVLAEEQAELARLLKDQHNAGIDAMARNIQRNAKRLFVPARDGL